jgi:ribosomal protein S18 acetylase RimI-like enzyme
MTASDTSLPTPPHEFTDGDGRAISVHRLEPEEYEQLVSMYDAFDPEDRAQGIPPVGENTIREWLDAVTEPDCFNVAGWYEDAAVGHAMLVPDRTGGYELAIFVLQEYQGAGIGTELVRTLLGLARTEDVEHVWLTVERWNRPAINLYEKIGFETTEDDSFEIEMALEIADLH